MPQRLTNQRQIFYATETTEGTDPNTESNSSSLVVSNLVVSPDLSIYRRPIVGQFGTLQGKVGAEANPWLSFTCNLRGGGAAGVAPELDKVLQSVFSQFTTASIDIHGYSATLGSVASDGKTITLATGSTSGLVVGAAVGLDTRSPANGTFEVGWVASITDGTHFVLTDPLVYSHTNGYISWQNGASIIGSYTYNPQNANHQSLTFQIYLDSSGSNNVLIFSGCKGSVKVDFPAPGVPATATFVFQAMSYSFANGSLSASTSFPVPPAPYQFTVGGTATSVKLVSWDLQQTIARKLSQNSTAGTSAQLVTGRDLIGSLQAYDIDQSQFVSWSNGTTMALAQQLGTSQYNIVAYQIRQAQYGRVTYGDDQGLTTDNVDFQGTIVSGADEVRVAFI